MISHLENREDRHLQHQQRQQAAGQPSRLAARGRSPTSCRLQELKAADREFPARRDREGGLRHRRARPEIVERGRDPRARRRADRHAHRAARRSQGRPEPLHRGRGERRDRHLALRAERQPAARAEIRLQARLDGAPAPPRGRASRRRACRSCSPATTTSCRPTATSIRPNPTRTTRSFSPSRAPLFQRLLDQGWIDAIRTLHTMSRCTRSGTICGTDGRAMPGCASITCCSARRPRSAWSASGVDRDVRGKDGASDHAPAWIILKDRGEGAAKRTAPAAQPRRPRKRRPAKPVDETRPLLVIDGDNLHAPLLSRAAEDDPGPRRQAGRRHRRLRQFPAAALSRRRSRARCSSRGTRWRAETYRHEAFADYQSGREFDDALRRSARRAAGAGRGLRFCERQGAPATRPTISSPPRSRPRRSAAARRWSRAATATRSSSPRSARRSSIPLRAGEMARIGPSEVRERYGVDPKQVPDFIALRGDPSDKLAGRAGRRSERRGHTPEDNTEASRTR